MERALNGESGGERPTGGEPNGADWQGGEGAVVQGREARACCGMERRGWGKMPQAKEQDLGAGIEGWA